MDNVKTQNPSADISIISGKNIILSVASGAWTVDYAIKTRDKIAKMSKDNFKGAKWAFVADVSNMAPIVDEEVSKAFASFHTEFEKINCTAVAFVVGRAIAIKAQAQRHHDTSGASELLVGHFKTQEESMKWLDSLGL